MTRWPDDTTSVLTSGYNIEENGLDAWYPFNEALADIPDGTAATYSYVSDFSSDTDGWDMAIHDGIFGYWAFEESIPDIPDDASYPGSTTKTTYVQDAWATTDGWTANGNTIDVTTNPGTLHISGLVANSMYKSVGTPPNAKLWRARIRASKTFTIKFQYYNGSVWPDLATFTVGTSWVICDGYLASGATNNFIYIGGWTASAGEWVEIDWIYIGTGARDTNPQDASGNGNHLALYGGRSVTGLSGNGLYLEGVASYAKTASTLSSIPDVWHFHISFPNGLAQKTSNYYIFNYKTIGSAWLGIRRSLNDDNLMVYYWNGSSDTYINWASIFTGYSATRIDIDVSINWTTGVVKVYRNGTAFGNSGTMTTPSKPTSGAYLYVASYQGTLTLPGTLDEVRIYERELSDAEVLNLYTNVGGSLTVADGILNVPKFAMGVVQRDIVTTGAAVSGKLAYLSASASADQEIACSKQDYWGRWIFDESLDSLPDGSSGTYTYSKDAFTDADIWTGNGSVGTSVSSGIVTDASAPYTGFYSSVASFTDARNKLVILDCKSDADLTLNAQFYSSATWGSAVAITTVGSTIGTTVWLVPSAAAAVTGVKFYLDSASAHPFMMDAIYIGTGERATVPADSSGHSRSMALYGGQTEASGYSSKALNFPRVYGGTAGIVSNYATVTLSGLSQKLTITAWLKFYDYSITNTEAQVLFESSILSDSNVGAFRVVHGDSTTGRGDWLKLILITAASESLSGYIQLTSAATSWHKYSFVFDTTQSGSSAIKIYIDDVLQTMTSISAGTARPALYNGTMYIGARAGRVVPAAFEIDDLQIHDGTVSYAPWVDVATMTIGTSYTSLMGYCLGYANGLKFYSALTQDLSISKIYLGTGTRVTGYSDRSGNDLDLTVVGTTRVPGLSGAGVKLDGSVSYMKTTSTLSSVPDVWHFHISFPNGHGRATGQQYIFDYKILGAAFLAVRRSANDDNILVYYYNGSDNAYQSWADVFVGYTSTRIDIDLDVNWTTGALKLYRNGVQFSTSKTMTTPSKPTSGSALYIGAYQGSSSYLLSTIDEVRIYNRALSDAEVAYLYSSITPYEALSAAPLTDGYRLIPQNTILRTDFSGYPKVRTRFLANTVLAECRYFVDNNQKQILDQFYDEHVADTFSWTNPETAATETVRFATAITYQSKGGVYWIAAFQLEIMP